MQRFAVFDIDHTIHRGSLANELALELIERGLICKSITEAQDFLAERKTYNLLRLFRAAKDIGINYQDYLMAAEYVGSHMDRKVNRRPADLMTNCMGKGMTTIAISHSPYPVVKPFCDHTGPFDIVVAPRPSNSEGYVGPSIVGIDKRDKGEWLRRIVELHDLVFDGSVGVGDSEPDIAMLRMVERAIAYRPSDELRAVAEQNQWEIWD
ncbi:MAG: haloacid dehalogenase-like hydrolase [Patescibacteria group bacterium]